MRINLISLYATMTSGFGLLFFTTLDKGIKGYEYFFSNFLSIKPINLILVMLIGGIWSTVYYIEKLTDVNEGFISM